MRITVHVRLVEVPGPEVAVPAVKRWLNLRVNIGRTSSSSTSASVDS